MKKNKLFLLMILIFLVAFSFAACGKSDKTPPVTTDAETSAATSAATAGLTTALTYTVTFRVNGDETKVEVAPGEVPVYPGDAEWEDGEHFYRILSWDADFTSATSDAVYTAEIGIYGREVFEVFWNVRDGILKTNVHAGETPTPPDIKETVYTDTTVYTFTGWSPALAPVTKNRTVFAAQYSESPMYYDVAFEANGEIVEVQTLAYGETPVPPTNVSLPSGYQYFTFGVMSPVTTAGQYIASFCNCDPIAYAYILEAERSDDARDRTSAGLFSILEEVKRPGEMVDHVLAYLRWQLLPANIPDFGFTPNFYYPMASATIALAKTLPTVWDALTAEEKEQLDLLMECFAIQGALATDDSCAYLSGPNFRGNYNKVWNSNYRLSNVTQMLFCLSYFGSADAVNAILSNFTYDTYIAKFQGLGWTPVLNCWSRETTDTQVDYIYLSYTTGLSEDPNHRWATIVSDDGAGHLTLSVKTSDADLSAGLSGYAVGDDRIVQYTTAKAMMEVGGDIYAMTAIPRIGQYVGKPCGSGIGVPAIGQKGYSYGGNTLDNPSGIWNALLADNYSGGVVTSKAIPSGDQYLCYIYDGTTSPVEGLEGMMREFNSGTRSSVSYCQVDFVMCVSSTSALEALGLYDTRSEANATRSLRAWIGNTDFLYKAEHGYVAKSGLTDNESSSVQFGKGNSFEIWRAEWLGNGATRYTLEEVLAPPPSSDPVLEYEIESARAAGSNDLTMGLGADSLAVRGTNHYWDNDLFLSFSFLYSADSPTFFEVRLRSKLYNNNAAARGPFMTVNCEAGTVRVSGTPIGDSPEAIPLGEYGWRRLTVGYHQGATANDATQSVTYSVTITIWLDGALGGSYEMNAEDFLNKAWLLFGAEYDPTAEGHLRYTDATPKPSIDDGRWKAGGSNNQPFFQIYRARIFNNEELRWFMDVGDVEVSCGKAPVSCGVPVDYRLNGGAFAPDESLPAKGYQDEYLVSTAVRYALPRAVKLKTPVRDGFDFGGWYTTADFSGDPVATVSSSGANGEPIVLYARWIPIS